MPRSFGVEALKVQAVAARTYAVSDILMPNTSQHLLDLQAMLLMYGKILKLERKCINEY